MKRLIAIALILAGCTAPTDPAPAPEIIDLPKTRYGDEVSRDTIIDTTPPQHLYGWQGVPWVMPSPMRIGTLNSRDQTPEATREWQ